MIYIAVICLILGIVCGQTILPASAEGVMDQIMSVALIAMIILVGIGIGTQKDVFQKVKQLGVKIMAIPAGILAGSLLGGMIVSFIFDHSLSVGLCISGGMGFSSVSTVILKELAGTQVATISFFANLMREVLSYVAVPLAAKYLNHMTAVAPCGATAMDTTLPAVTRYTDMGTAVAAVISGATLTALVPMLLPFLYGLGI